MKDAASIAIIGAADGPTSIFVAQRARVEVSGRDHRGGLFLHGAGADHPAAGHQADHHQEGAPDPHALCAAARSPRRRRILFPIIITIIAGLVAPRAVGLVGFLMFGNLIRECGVLNSLSETAQKVAGQPDHAACWASPLPRRCRRTQFLQPETLLILAPGPGGLCVRHRRAACCSPSSSTCSSKKKINPMIGAAGISAFPMSARVVNKMGLKEDNAELPADARRRRQRLRPDRLCHRGRPDSRACSADADRRVLK